MADSVDRFFDALTDDYTAVIERCFPSYREMLGTLIRYLPDERPCRSILDLGCGTGNLSLLIRQTHPAAQLTCVDLSRDSLQVCRQRLAALSRGRSQVGELRFEAADFGALQLPPEQFDLVVSGIAIHHVPSPAKRKLFADCFRWLRPGGVLTFADQFRGETEQVYAKHVAFWKQCSLEAGGSEEEFAMWMEHQQEHDHHDTLRDQLTWLAEAGFAKPDCLWRQLLWAVVQAEKPSKSVRASDGNTKGAEVKPRKGDASTSAAWIRSGRERRRSR